ncbi:hypothetical protein M3P05_14190 [Sansalvadorimonas sp. 2012CJ34-2]|uniref:Uncharacterized protein n=1 Tax=Parendozoicomonas callyspongiae TaxID=2942213 RepID=A0ABT0PIB0_9GAMM|nr:hypothetical protein [Sansalvadorimonas sp. 2012CJ34-2]MCL6271075.1 hypothetical protein [Sansalvadorimonas sp. 2012CJ34-2]
MMNVNQENKVIRASLESVMADYPTLTDTGFLTKYNSDSRTWEEYHHKLAERREALCQAIESYRETMIWLRCIEPLPSINEEAHSYRMKHHAEHSIQRYVSNGTFIAAALTCGFQMKRCPDSSPNVWFNMSSASLGQTAVY